MFAEARDIIEDARDDAETVYFNDAHAEAKDAVGECLAKYDPANLAYPLHILYILSMHHQTVFKAPHKHFDWQS